MEILQTELFNYVRGLVQPEARVRIISIEDSKVYKKRTTICIQRKLQSFHLLIANTIAIDRCTCPSLRSAYGTITLFVVRTYSLYLLY